jgi:UDP-glucuronate decarboxylase
MIEPLPKDMGHFDYIVHAAGIASPMFYRAHPLKCIDANINGLRNLLDYSVAGSRGRAGTKGIPFLLIKRDLR